MTKKLDPVSPGEMLLEEFLKPLSMSKYRLAKEINVPAQRIGEIIAGAAPSRRTLTCACAGSSDSQTAGGCACRRTTTRRLRADRSPRPWLRSSRGPRPQRTMVQWRKGGSRQGLISPTANPRVTLRSP
jgi:hypothetical protein